MQGPGGSGGPRALRTFLFAIWPPGPGPAPPGGVTWRRLNYAELQYIKDLEVPGSYYFTTQAAPEGLNGGIFENKNYKNGTQELWVSHLGL